MRQFGMLGFAVTLFWLVMMVAVSASAETIELVTYYPAPGGGNVETDRVHANRATIGDTYSLMVPADAVFPDGTLLVEDRLGVGLGLNLPLGPLHVVGRSDVVESVVFMPGTGAGAELRVGIGTDNPLPLPGGGGPDQTNLDIRRNITLGGTTVSNVGSVNWRDYTTDAWWHLSMRGGGNLELHGRTTTTGAAVIPLTTTLAGNVGIGMNPQMRLDVEQNTAIRVGNAYLSSGGAQWAHFGSNAWFDGSANWQIPNPARASGLLQFLDSTITFFQRAAGAGVNAWTARMTITPNGNVGIRTDAPRHPLEVVGAGGLTTLGWSRGVLLSAGAALSWDRGGQPNCFFMAHPSGSPPGDFWAGFSPALNGTTAPTYAYRIYGNAANGPVGTVVFFRSIIAAGSTFPSDERLKSRVVPLTNVLERLRGLQAVSFEWNDRYEAMGYHRTPGERTIGLTAQEVERAFPELVTTWGEHGYKGVDYSRLTTVLVEAVKEQQAQIRALQSQNDTLKKRVEKLEK